MVVDKETNWFWSAEPSHTAQWAAGPPSVLEGRRLLPSVYERVNDVMRYRSITGPWR